MDKKKLIIIVSIIVGALVIVSLYGTFASNTTVDGGDNTYAITLTGSSSEIVVPAGKSKIVIYQITNTNKGKVQYGVVYSGNDITVKYYFDSQDAHTGTIDYGENKFIKLNVQNSGTSDSTLTIKTIIGYEKGGSLDSLIPSGYSLVTESFTPPVNLLSFLKKQYTSGNLELITQDVTNAQYYYSYQDTDKTWGLMNDGLKIDNKRDAETTGLATTVTDTEALTSGTEGNIRYFGPSDSVNNYIYFNCSDYLNQTDSTCEKWRIIGIVDGKVKIIRNDSIGDLAWDQDKNQDSSLTTYNNNWVASSLQEFLNGLYYNRGTIESHPYYSGSTGTTTTTLNLKTIGITEATRNNNLILESTWYLGGYSTSSGLYPNDIYNYERQNKVGTTIYSTNDFIINKNIGLMYASDYGYGTDLTKCSTDINKYHNVSACTTGNWLFNNKGQWLITPRSSNSNYAWYVTSTGGVYSNGNVYPTNRGVRPVLYLETELLINKGDGLSDNPYQIYVAPDAEFIDSTAPTCTLSVNSDNTISFITKSDDVGVEEYGLSNSSAATYNGNNSISIQTGTIYGYVKDAAGNSGSCSVSIIATEPYNDDLSMGCEELSYATEEEICSWWSSDHVPISNNCRAEKVYDVREYGCDGSYGYVTCGDGTQYSYSPYQWYQNFEAVTPEWDWICGLDGISSIEEPVYSWSDIGWYQDTSCSSSSASNCDGYWDIGNMYTECSDTGEYQYSGSITCRAIIYDCHVDYAQLNNSYCYKHN